MPLFQAAWTARSQPIPLDHLETFLNLPVTPSQVVARHHSALLCMAVISAFSVVPVHAAGTAGSDTQKLAESYAAMCTKAVRIPAAHGGEGDLKGHAKLPDYCKCFAEKFLARALKPSAGAPASMEQTIQEEYGMRQTCRSQLGLPPPPKV